MVQIELTDKIADLEQIVRLQRLNHANIIEENLWEHEGFVTLEFTTQKLAIMKGPYKHVVAKLGSEVVGYALVLLRDSGPQFPFLTDMFATIDAAMFTIAAEKKKKYFVMGQICVEKKMRGKGLFKLLYQKLKEQMSADFDLVFTEVSPKNVPSTIAHQRLGFKKIRYPHNKAGDWEVIAWDWK